MRQGGSDATKSNAATQTANRVLMCFGFVMAIVRSSGGFQPPERGQDAPATNFTGARCSRYYSFVIVSSKFRIALATTVHAASSATSSFSFRGDSPIFSRLSAVAPSAR